MIWSSLWFWIKQWPKEKGDLREYKKDWYEKNSHIAERNFVSAAGLP